jgi:hypothetical protein
VGVRGYRVQAEEEGDLALGVERERVLVVVARVRVEEGFPLSGHAPQYEG